jgi:hypothetical protein
VTGARRADFRWSIAGNVPDLGREINAGATRESRAGTATGGQYGGQTAGRAVPPRAGAPRSLWTALAHGR